MLDEEHPSHARFRRMLELWWNASSDRDGLGYRRVFRTKYPMCLRISGESNDFARPEELLNAGTLLVIEGRSRSGIAGEMTIVRKAEKMHEDARGYRRALPALDRRGYSVTVNELIQCIVAEEDGEETVFELLKRRTLDLDDGWVKAAPKPVPKPVPKDAPVDLGPDELALIDQLIPKSLPAGYGDF
jgi:hypothetical protein